MGPPTLWQHVRQVLGRAVRETGQALDQLGVKTVALAVTKNDYYDDPVIYEDSLSRHRHQFPLLTSGRPVIHPAGAAFLAPCSTLIGSVYVGKNASIWYGAVLRGDTCENAQPRLPASNTTPTTTATTTTTTTPAITDDDSLSSELFLVEPWELPESRWRDQTTHHGGAIFIGNDTNIQDNCLVTAKVDHCCIGHGVTVGHLAQLHSCTVHDYCLIGMGSVINEGVVVGRETLVAAGAVVRAHTHVGSGELWVGNPARKLRDLTAADRQRLHYQSSEYVKVALTQTNVMALGGNLDPNGISVHLLSEEDEPVPSPVLEAASTGLDRLEARPEIRQQGPAESDATLEGEPLNVSSRR